MSATVLYIHAANSILLGAGVAFLPVPWRRMTGVLAALGAFVSGANPLQSWIGAPSMTLTLLALMRLVCRTRETPTIGRGAAWLLIGFASLFYPLSLGVGSFDPFDAGYRPRLLLLALAPVGLLLARRRQGLVLAVLGVDLLAYAAGLFDNLWNAFLDPLLVLIAATRLASPIWSTRIRDGALRENGSGPTSRDGARENQDRLR